MQSMLVHETASWKNGEKFPLSIPLDEIEGRDAKVERTARIARIKREILKGTYRCDGTQIAKKLIERNVTEELLKAFCSKLG